MNLSLLLALLLLQAPAETPQERLAAIQQKLRRFDASMAGELLEQADQDPDPAVRRMILERLARLPLPAVRDSLERHAAGDPDAGVALAALESLRLRQAQELGRLFEKRLALARSEQDQKALEALTAQHQQWLTFARRHAACVLAAGATRVRCRPIEALRAGAGDWRLRRGGTQPACGGCGSRGVPS